MPLRLEADRQRRAHGPPRRQSVPRPAALRPVRLGLSRIRRQVLGAGTTASRSANPSRSRVDPDRLALACLAADRQGALVPCCRLLQQLIFVDGVVIDDGVIAGLAGQLELDKAAFQRDLAAPATRTRHDALLDGSRRTRRVRRADLLPWAADVLGQRSPCAARGSTRQSHLVSLLTARPRTGRRRPCRRRCTSSPRRSWPCGGDPRSGRGRCSARRSCRRDGRSRSSRR